MLLFWDAVTARFLDSLRLGQGTRLLDVGSGPGTLVRLATSAGIEARGVEPFWPELHPRVVRGYAEELPFPDASFDVATCFSVIEYLADPERSLREVARVLRAGGRAIVAVPDLAAYPGLRRERYRHVTSPRWFGELVARVPELRVAKVRGFGVRYLVPVAKRTVVRLAPRLGPRALAAIYARRFPMAVADITVWTLSR